MLHNTRTTYGTLTRLLHWVMAVQFIIMFGLAYIMTSLPKSAFRYTLYDIHKATGLLLLVLAIVRIGWRFTNTQPDLSSVVARWQHLAAKSNVILLYCMMLLMPVTGILTSTLGGHDITFYHLFTIHPLGNNAGLSELFANAHEILSYIIIGAFSLHVAGALYHYYVIKDNVLQRML